jgi:SnoaL-like domain
LKAEIETHQYNPTYMPASTPVRVAIVIAALVGIVVGYRWWTNPERQIHRLLSEVASALSHDGAESDLRAVAAVASLQNHLAPDVSIDVGGRAAPLRGRPDVMSMAARLRASNQMIRVQFFDPDIQLSNDSSGTTKVTVQVTTRDARGDEVADAHVVSIALVKAEGRWQIAGAHVLPKDAAL